MIFDNFVGWILAQKTKLKRLDNSPVEIIRTVLLCERLWFSMVKVEHLEPCHSTATIITKKLTPKNLTPLELFERSDCFGISDIWFFGLLASRSIEQSDHWTNRHLNWEIFDFHLDLDSDSDSWILKSWKTFEISISIPGLLNFSQNLWFLSHWTIGLSFASTFGFPYCCTPGLNISQFLIEECYKTTIKKTWNVSLVKLLLVGCLDSGNYEV